MLKRKDVNMLSGPIVKGLLTIAFPIMIMNVLTSLFNIIDMRMLKAYDTGLSVGAVGVCGTPITFISNLVVGIATGANVLVARHIGRKEPLDAEKAAGTAVALSLVAGLALMVIGVVFAGPILDVVNCSQELKDHGAVLYFRMYFAGIPLLMVYNFCASILRSTGNSRRIMVISITSGLVKIAVTYLFVRVVPLSVMGVSLANIAAWLVFLGLGLWSLTQKSSTVKLRWKNIRFDKAELGPILRVGVPSALQMSMYSIANVIIASAVNKFGTAASTGVSIANNFDGILYNVCHATSLAVLPYVSQNIGAGNIKRASDSVWKGILVTVGIGAFFGALSAIFSTQLSGIMSDDPEVIAWSRQKMIIISSTYFICGINDIFCAALRGMGKPIVPTIATLIFMCGLRFAWVYWVFPLVPNITFLYLVWPIGWVLSIVSLLPIYLYTVRQLKEKHSLAAKQ